MIDLNELKRLADTTYDTSLTVNEYRDAFDALMENVDAEVICKLLAIQAQLVEALKYSKRFLKKEDADIDFIDAALAAAGAQP